MRLQFVIFCPKGCKDLKIFCQPCGFLVYGVTSVPLLNEITAQIFALRSHDLSVHTIKIFSTEENDGSASMGLATSCFTKYQLLLHSQSKKKPQLIKLMIERRNAQYIRKMHVFISWSYIVFQIHSFCFLQFCCFIRNYYFKIFKILNYLYNYFSDPIIAISQRVDICI